MSIGSLKALAKKQLHENLWPLIGLCAIYSIIVGGLGAIPAVGSIAVFVVAPPIMLGFYIALLKQTRGGNASIGEMFEHFTDIGKPIVLMLLMTLYIILWSLLFVIPGIVKAYSYSMAFYIMADHPEYSAKECLTESRRIMSGNKMKLFLLGLSFIGWMLLSLVTFGIAYFYVAPYQSLATTNFYNDLIGYNNSVKTGGVVIDEDGYVDVTETQTEQPRDYSQYNGY